MHAKPSLTKQLVVDQLTAQLRARRTLSARQRVAYSRLAHAVLGQMDIELHRRIAATPISQPIKNAA